SAVQIHDRRKVFANLHRQPAIACPDGPVGEQPKARLGNCFDSAVASLHCERIEATPDSYRAMAALKLERTVVINHFDFPVHAIKIYITLCPAHVHSTVAGFSANLAIEILQFYLALAGPALEVAGDGPGV